MTRVNLSIVISPLVGAILAVTSCGTTVDNPAGTPTAYQDIRGAGLVAGVGIESQDIVSMTDQMARGMLSTEQLAGSAVPPRVILDTEYFVNDSSQRINKSLIVDRLRIGLQRAAAGRLMFVSREHAGMVAQERDLKRAGMVDVATTGLARAQAGADYRLGGRISSLDARTQDGMVQRYNQIVFEMIDLETGLIIWSDVYEFRKATQVDAVYR